MPDRPCQRPGCGNQIPSRKRQDARWCSRKCEGRATRAAKRMGIGLADYVKGVSYSPVEDRSLAELHGKAGPPSWRDDPRNFSDYGDLPGDAELAAEFDDEHQGDERGQHFHEMVQADAAQRKPRWSWFDLRQRYNQNPGIELPSITRERTERYRTDQAAIQRRLRTSTGQPQDRHNAVTRDVVASRATESRRLNHHYATADPRPVPQQEFDFTAESFNGGPFRQGRPSGQRSANADYRWRMEDGFRF